MSYIVYADSNQRDQGLYPSGNSYTLHLTNPIKNVSRVDLVSAIVPNTMYNLTQGTNVLLIDDKWNVSLNPGFYSTCTLTNEFNNSGQVSSNVASLAYLCSEGRFIFYGDISNVTCQTSEISQLLGLPLGKTQSVTMASSPVYANNAAYVGANNYVKSTSIVNMNLNEYVWLDINEFRTPRTLDARRLITSNNVWTTLGNTASTSFALIPMDVQAGTVKSFKEHFDYSMSIEFPSRLDSFDRLTIRWLDRNGNVLNFNGLDTNSFTLRVHTVHVPTEPERPPSLPPPVPETEQKKIIIGVMISLVLGLLMILMRRHR